MQIYLVILILMLFNWNSTANSYTTAAEQAILIDYETGQILFENNSTELMHPSSMTKIMTTYLTFAALQSGKISLNDHFLTSEKAWRMKGSKMFLNWRDEPTVEELLKGMIIQSGNDACVVLAEGLAGSEDDFVIQMNKQAKLLKMYQTNFTNASGWPDPNNLSTAKDLSKLAVAIIKDFPQYYHYHKMKQFSYGRITQPNRNILIGKMGVDGIKTGHTDIGGYGIVLSAFYKNRRLIAVINGLKSDKLRSKEGEAILSYGFNAFSDALLFKHSDQIAQAKVVYGDRPLVGLTVKEDLHILSNNTSDKIRCTVSYMENIKPPITVGQKLGKVRCKVANIHGEYIENELIASEEVKAANFAQKLVQNLEHILH